MGVGNLARMPMASESRPNDLSGYDYQFLQSPPDELVCLICTCVAKDPQQLVCCGRVFCRECLSKQQGYSNKCPQCRQPYTGFNDIRGDRNIKSLKVKCSNFGRGCEWTGELRSVEEHHSTCDYGLIQCPNHCIKEGEENELLRKNLIEHLQAKCLKRQYKCPHCKKTGEYQERITSHLKNCPQVETTCPNSPCTAHPLRCEADDHRHVCEYEEVSCKYADIGCNRVLQRKYMTLHEKNAEEHFPIAIETIRMLKEQVSPFHFKLAGFAEQKKKNTEYFSKPFYTHPGGYRMCIQVNANGKGVGRNTHISFYVCLMKGLNDDNLSWPYLGTVTISLLNQLEDRKHHVQDVNFYCKDDFTRVVGDKERGVGWGYEKFVAHTDLNYNPIKYCLYLKSDCLYFKVTASVVHGWLHFS